MPRSPWLAPVLLSTSLSLVACGGEPASTKTTTASSVERTASGEEVERDSTETRNTESDGSTSTTRTETTRTTTPASNPE